MPSRISIIVPVLNAEKTIKQCITSLLNQDYGNYEIIVINNNSTDKTAAILNEFKGRIKILNEPKRNSYIARNKGIRHAKGQIIVFTDSDCIAEKDWLKNISGAFDNKAVKIAGGEIRAYRIKNSVQKYLDIFGHPQNLSAKCNKPYFAGSNIAVRKKTLLEVGMFNENLLSGGDYEICLRIIKNKNEIQFVPNALVNHFYSKSLIKFMKKQYYYGKWQKEIRKYPAHVQLPGLFQILREYGLIFFFIRVIGDISYSLGYLLG